MEIQRYFPNLTSGQLGQLEALEALYGYWNARVNVISRKDISRLYTRHVLHSLGIAKVQAFLSGSQILDVGTGRGVSGAYPWQSYSPKCIFTWWILLEKMLKVVVGITQALGLKM